MPLKKKQAICTLIIGRGFDCNARIDGPRSSQLPECKTINSLENVSFKKKVTLEYSSSKELRKEVLFPGSASQIPRSHQNLGLRGATTSEAERET